MKTGWEVKPLGEVCEIYQPKTISKKEMTNDGAYPVFGANGVIGRYDQFNHEAPQLLITCRGATCGSVNVSDPFSWITGNSMVVRPKTNDLDQEFLKYFFLGAVDLSGVITGAAQPQITRASLSPVTLCIPPLEEQKRIVAVLDAAFEGLTRAKENAEANLQNARELFENSELELFDKHTGHITASNLGDFADFRNGLNFSKNSTGQTIKIVGVGDFQDHFWIPLEQLKSVSIEGKLSDQDMIDEHDILAVRSNGNKELIGRVMLAGPISVPTSFSGFTIRIRLNADEVSPEFVCYFMKTKAMRKLLSAGGDGANISNLNQQLLSNLEMRVPSKNVQCQVIEEAKALREAYDYLLASYRTKLTDIADMRQSLLQMAFAGELT